MEVFKARLRLWAEIVEELGGIIRIVD